MHANTKTKYARHVIKWEEYMRERFPDLWIGEDETPKASLYYMYILYIYYIDIGKSWGSHHGVCSL